MKFNEDPYNVFGWISFVKGHKSKITYFCFFFGPANSAQIYLGGCLESLAESGLCSTKTFIGSLHIIQAVW